MINKEPEVSVLKIQYFLEAEFTPINARDVTYESIIVPHPMIPTKKTYRRRISTFHGLQLILIYQPEKKFPVRDLQLSLTSKVGGFFGIGSKEALTTIIFEKNEYYLGEKARVKIICDNSHSKNAVKHFKLKLHRKFIGFDNENQATLFSHYCAVLKTDNGCPAKTKVERELEIIIPQTESTQLEPKNSNPDE